MDWSDRTHTHTRRRCWKVIFESHFNWGNGAVSCAPVSSNDVTPAAAAAGWRSPRERRSQTDDLADDKLRRSICNLCVCCSRPLFFNLGKTALINDHDVLAERDEGVFACGWIRLLQSIVKPNQEAKHIEGLRERERERNSRRREWGAEQSFDLATSMTVWINRLTDASSDTSTSGENFAYD